MEFPLPPAGFPPAPRVPPSSEPPAGSESKKGVRRSPLPPRAPQPRRPSPPGLSSDLSAQAEGSARRPDAHLTPGRLAFHATSRPGKHLPPTASPSPEAAPRSRQPLHLCRATCCLGVYLPPASSPMLSALSPRPPASFVSRNQPPRQTLTPNCFASPETALRSRQPLHSCRATCCLGVYLLPASSPTLPALPPKPPAFLAPRNQPPRQTLTSQLLALPGSFSTHAGRPVA